MKSILLIVVVTLVFLQVVSCRDVQNSSPNEGKQFRSDEKLESDNHKSTNIKSMKSLSSIGLENRPPSVKTEPKLKKKIEQPGEALPSAAKNGSSSSYLQGASESSSRKASISSESFRNTVSKNAQAKKKKSNEKRVDKAFGPQVTQVNRVNNLTDNSQNQTSSNLEQIESETEHRKVKGRTAFTLGAGFVFDNNAKALAGAFLGIDWKNGLDSRLEVRRVLKPSVSFDGEHERQVTTSSLKSVLSLSMGLRLYNNFVLRPGLRFRREAVNIDIVSGNNFPDYASFQVVNSQEGSLGLESRWIINNSVGVYLEWVKITWPVNVSLSHRERTSSFLSGSRLNATDEAIERRLLTNGKKLRSLFFGINIGVRL